MQPRYLTAPLFSICLLLTLPLFSCSSLNSPLDEANSSLSSLADDPISNQEEIKKENIKEKSKTFKLDDISVTATKSVRKTYDTPRFITLASEEEISNDNQMSVLDALNDKVGIWIEKRTSTTSDPVMRGFSGGNLLALVNGNSLTSLWGEGGYAGDDMYGKVDGESVKKIEVIRGPSSVLYGSNALGGVINFILKSCPIDYTEEGMEGGGLTKLSYGSATNEYRVRQEVWGASRDFKFFLGGTMHRAHDVEGGRGLGTLRPSGGTDFAWDFNSSYRINEYQEIELAVQDIHRKNIRRFYKPNQKNTNDREALTLTWKATKLNNMLDELKVWGYYQDKKDVRDDFGNSMSGESTTKTYALDVQGVSLVGDDHRFTYGAHYNEDHGVCPDDEQFAWTDWSTGVKEKVAPDSVWNDIGVYLQDEWDMSEDFTVIASGRYDKFRFTSDVDKHYVAYVANNPTHFAPGYDPHTDDISDSKGALSGGLGLLYRVDENVNLIANYAHGYRLFAPKFGLTYHAGPDFYLAPHNFYDPVESDTFELGGKALFDKFAASLCTYYSAIRNWQTNVPGSYNGMTSIAGSPVYQTSTGKANIYGVEVETETMLNLIHKEIPETWSLAVGFCWNYGNDKANDEPIRHTQPARGLAALRWKDSDRERKGWFEFAADMVRQYDRIPSDRLTSDFGYQVDPQNKQGVNGLIRSYGLPGYTVLNVRGGLDLRKDLSLTVAVENLTDKKYRAAHSRMDSPGVNFLTSVTYRF